MGASLWNDVLSGRVSPARSRATLEVGSFMIETIKAGVQLRVGQLQSTLSYVNDLSESQKEKVDLFVGFTVQDLSQSENISPVAAADKIQRLLKSGDVKEVASGTYRLADPNESNPDEN